MNGFEIIFWEVKSESGDNESYSRFHT